MTGTFFGINVASSGLAAQRAAMDILSQNISHANDPSYKRQRLIVTEGLPIAETTEVSSFGTSIIGSGVMTSLQVGAVQRIRDAVVERRLQTAGESSAQYDYMAKTLHEIEAAIGEPSDTGLQADLDKFWNSWSKVAGTPDSIAIRNTLLDDTQALCSRIQYIYGQMGSAIDDLNTSAVSDVSSINQMAQEIARINSEVSIIPVSSSESNDLLNRRDALMQDLSKLASVSQSGEGGGDFTLTLGGRVLVQGIRSNALKTEAGPDGNKAIRWADDGKDAIIQGGELKAIQDLRDTIIPGYMSKLDDLATTLVQKVNALHTTGKTMAGANGGDFFLAGSTTATLALDPDIEEHPELIAASSSATGDGNDVALAMWNLKGETDPATGLTINGLYGALVSAMGADTSMADRQSEAYNLSFLQFQSQQQSISGVSLDEEMTNMIKFQQAYNASSRLLTVMDEMLSTLIERTGTVGR